MPYEVFGVDLETPEGQAAFLDAYVLAHEANVEDVKDRINESDVMSGFFETAPANAAAFVLSCAAHESPHVRDFAAGSLDHVLEVDKEGGLSAIESILKDEDADVAARTREFYIDLLRDEGYSLFETLGAEGMARLLRTMRLRKGEAGSRQLNANTPEPIE